MSLSLVFGRFCLALAVLAMAMPAAAAAEGEEKSLVPAVVTKILKRNSLGASNAGLYMVWDDGTPIAMLNLDRPFNPASSVKLVTSMASLELLGPAHTWRSKLLAAAPIVDGSLRGDLFFQGSGDPFMTNERLLHLVTGAYRRGIKHVAGDVIVDDTLFELDLHDPAAFDGRGTSLYNAAPGAAVVNFGASNVIIRAVNGSITVLLDPPSTTFTVNNKLKLRKSRCSGNWRSRLRERLKREETGEAKLELSGNFPTGCKERSFFLLGQSDPIAHTAGAIGGIIEVLGGSVSGGWRNGKAPRNAQTVSEIESQTLSEVLRGMNKNSNNFMARNVFLSLGENGGRKPYTLAKARSAIDGWFASHEIDTTGMYIENGSGLSRLTRITPRQFGEALYAFNNSLLRHELIASLSILGRDGTARSWNKRSKSAGAAHIKTGTLSNARSTVGVVHNPEGDIIFVFLAETRGTALARRAIQELLEWSYKLPRPSTSS